MVTGAIPVISSSHFGGQVSDLLATPLDFWLVVDESATHNASPQRQAAQQHPFAVGRPVRRRVMLECLDAVSYG